uniref:Xylosyltransferase 2 n=1 Tax=Anthurium amnicola TaxID=1678845 RepID=A0A1D1Y8C9_9ARAE
MRKNVSHHSARIFSDRGWLIPFYASLLVSITLFFVRLLLSSSFFYGGNMLPSESVPFSGMDYIDGNFIKQDLERPDYSRVELEPEPPRIAYLITGTKGDSLRMRRTLQAIYHPRNQYILHLDLEAPPRERIELSSYVKGDPVYSEVENVRVIAKGNLVTYKGPTMIACTLHAIAILLKEGVKWDWFINLSASDYPLVTQDDLLYVFSSVPRHLNFIELTHLTGWKLNQRAKPIVIDPGLYLSKKFDIVITSERRELPSSFKLFTGSAWVMLTRSFLEYCIWGWENLPRTILMYYVNFVSSPEGYFHTVICNSEKFRESAVSHDLHHIAWDTPPKQHPLTLSLKDYGKMLNSSAPFARKFHKNDPVLDMIDHELLGRSDGKFTPGAWCVGTSDDGADPCHSRGSDSVFRPGPGSKRLERLLQKLQSEDFRNGTCS